MESATADTPTDAPPEADAEPGAPEADAAGAASAQQPEPAGDGERDETGKFLSREAASYRRRLRETEAERDQLRERVEKYEREHVERLASDAGLAVASDVWTFGASLDNLRGETGDLDAEAINSLVGEIVANRPGLKATPVGDLGIGRGAGATSMRVETRPGLSALLKPSGRR